MWYGTGFPFHGHLQRTKMVLPFMASKYASRMKTMTIENFHCGSKNFERCTMLQYEASNNVMEVLSRWMQCNPIQCMDVGCSCECKLQVKCNCHSCTKQKLFDSLHLLTEKFLLCLCLNFSQIVWYPKAKISFMERTMIYLFRMLLKRRIDACSSICLSIISMCTLPIMAGQNSNSFASSCSR